MWGGRKKKLNKKSIDFFLVVLQPNHEYKIIMVIFKMRKDEKNRRVILPKNDLVTYDCLRSDGWTDK